MCTSHPHRPSNSWSGCRPHPLVTRRDDLIYRGWGALGREGLTPYPVSIPGLRGLGASIPLARLYLPSTFGDVSASVTQVWTGGGTVCTCRPEGSLTSGSAGSRLHPRPGGTISSTGYAAPSAGWASRQSRSHLPDSGIWGKYPIVQALPPCHLRASIWKRNQGLKDRYDSVHLPPIRAPNLWVGLQSSPSETGNDDRVCRGWGALGRVGVTPHPVPTPGLRVLGQVSSWRGSTSLPPSGMCLPV